MTVRIHHVSCSTTSGPGDTESFAEAEVAARKIEFYARTLGFSVMYENVDEGDPQEEPSWDRD